MVWKHLFLPHTQTHQKAHLISWHGLLIYMLIFMLAQVSFSIFSQTKPGILGINAQISRQQVIELTNKEREKVGLPPLSENLSLDQAATAKAADMFAENYWAHFAPSGKTPWDFIQAYGYKFNYAGENLAKNFYTSQDVVTAWIASPSHRENIINARYKDIGIAVVDGVLNGQKTTLVVQMFGTRATLAQAPAVDVNGQKISVVENETVPTLVASAQTQRVTAAAIDPYQVYKVTGVGVLSLVGFLLAVDFLVLKRRGVIRPAAHHFASFSFLAAGAVTLVGMHPGAIL